MRAVAISLSCLLLCACASGSANDGNATDEVNTNFPRAGVYHYVRERTDGDKTEREEGDTDLEVSDREKLSAQLAEDAGSNCRDKQVNVGSGSFSVRMTCSAPDGDFNHIAVNRNGTFSSDSIDVTTESSLLGMTYRDRFSYRLKQ